MNKLYYKFIAKVFNLILRLYVDKPIIVYDCTYFRLNFMKYIPEDAVKYMNKDILISCLCRFYKNINLYNHKLPKDILKELIDKGQSVKLIAFMRQPSEEIQLWTVRRNVASLFLFKHPTQKVILECLAQFWTTGLYNEIKSKFDITKETEKEINKMKLIFGPMEEYIVGYHLTSKGSEAGSKIGIIIMTTERL